MKKTLLFAMLMYALASAAQSTTVSSTGVVDADGVMWANGTYLINFIPGAGAPNASVWNGNTSMAGNSFYSGTMNGSGAFSKAIPSNALIQPAGSQWAFTVCPLAT